MCNLVLPDCRPLCPVLLRLIGGRRPGLNPLCLEVREPLGALKLHLELGLIFSLLFVLDIYFLILRSFSECLGLASDLISLEYLVLERWGQPELVVLFIW